MQRARLYMDKNAYLYNYMCHVPGVDKVSHCEYRHVLLPATALCMENDPVDNNYTETDGRLPILQLLHGTQSQQILHYISHLGHC